MKIIDIKKKVITENERIKITKVFFKKDYIS